MLKQSVVAYCLLVCLLLVIKHVHCPSAVLLYLNLVLSYNLGLDRSLGLIKKVKLSYIIVQSKA